MNIEEYSKLLKDYEGSVYKICFEKSCGYKFIAFFNKYQSLNDIYNYVHIFYVHVNNPIHIYIDKEHKKEIPNSPKIMIHNYFLMNNIKKLNSSERIIVEDKFYPTERNPKIIFSYKSEFYNDTISILIIEGVCKNNSSYISLSAPLLRPNADELKRIRKQIIENKKLNEKNEFDNNVSEKEKSIDTQGLQ